VPSSVVCFGKEGVKKYYCISYWCVCLQKRFHRIPLAIMYQYVMPNWSTTTGIPVIPDYNAMHTLIFYQVNFKHVGGRFSWGYELLKQCLMILSDSFLFLSLANGCSNFCHKYKNYFARCQNPGTGQWLDSSAFMYCDNFCSNNRSFI
jgi:hypothetical protein